jgi:alpha-mannosidase
VDVPIAQSGDYLFRYSVLTHGAEWTYNDAHHFGWSFMSPLRAYAVEAAQQGEWPEGARSFIEIVPENVYLAGFKSAEDGDGVILRLYEGAGVATEAAVRFNIPGQTLVSAQSCDGRERNLASLKTEGNSMPVELGAWESSTVRVRLK